MAAITKSALKAIKFYKHVVQSVEKFIQKVNEIFMTIRQINLTFRRAHLCVRQIAHVYSPKGDICMYF